MLLLLGPEDGDGRRDEVGRDAERLVRLRHPVRVFEGGKDLRILRAQPEAAELRRARDRMESFACLQAVPPLGVGQNRTFRLEVEVMEHRDVEIASAARRPRFAVAGEPFTDSVRELLE